MSGMIRKEIAMIMNNKKFLLVAFLVYVFYSVLFDMDMSFYLPFMAAMLCITSFSYDDYNNWQTYASSLPQGKISIVRSKYIVGLGFAFIAAVLELPLFSLTGSVRGNLDVAGSVSSILGVMVAIIFMLSVLFPILFRYGGEKGRLAMIILGLGMAGIVIIMTKFVHISVSDAFMTAVVRYLPLAAVILVVVMICVSYFISKKIYLKREF